MSVCPFQSMQTIRKLKFFTVIHLAVIPAEVKILLKNRFRMLMISNNETPTVWLGPDLFAFVLFPCCKATTDMPLLLVLVKNFSNFGIENLIILRKSLCQIFMYRRLGYVKMFGRRPNGGAGFDHVHSQFAGSLLKCFRPMFPSDAVCC